MDSPACIHTLARWNLARDDEALAGWDRLVAVEPRKLRSLFLAARAFGEKYRFGRFTELVERIRRLNPQSAAVHLAIGDLHRGVGLHPQAGLDYEKAATCRDATPETFLALAASLERGHDFQQARHWLKRAKNHPVSLLIASRLHRREQKNAPAADLLHQLVAMAPAGSDLLAEAHGELALLHDSAGDYAAAFEAIGHAKAIHLERCQAEQAACHHVTHRFAKMVDSITPDDFTRWAAEAGDGEISPVPALLTGFPRSGTTLLEQVLDAHPQIGSSEEIDVLAREIFPAAHHGLGAQTDIQQVLQVLQPAQLAEHRRFYWETLKFLAPGNQLGPGIHIDKNPALNLLIPFYLRLFPKARLLIAVRDPRDVLLSCYLRYLPLNPVSVTFLSLASTAHRYALDMTAWLRFSEMIPQPWQEVRYEDLVADFPGEARKICATLGLPWDDAVLTYRERLAGKAIASPTYADVTRPIYRGSIQRWKHYERFLAPQFDTLAPFIEAFGYSGTQAWTTA